MNRPREEKETQTIIQGKKLKDIDSIFKENEELRKLVTMNDDRLVELVEENQVLLDEIDSLLKQQVNTQPLSLIAF